MRCAISAARKPVHSPSNPSFSRSSTTTRTRAAPAIASAVVLHRCNGDVSTIDGASGRILAATACA